MAVLETKFGLAVYGNIWNSSLVEVIACTCALSTSWNQKVHKHSTINLTANSYLDTPLSNLFEFERYGVVDVGNNLSVLEKMSIDNVIVDYQIHDLCNGTKCFHLRIGFC